ncbi:hypothetical protein HHL19_36450 [Streptomyces sp. R302]|uniref:hypothetical protein n=1 Tax=unclassified Streptomyces TaxID=2593676 RepID=UPI00145E13F9|nr:MULTISPECIES: hypothetical protein [unclassified Streptomyces]NML55655.1 hypothetical protein [Streptomyces sp. R301]NML84003.1 hypothetical protein [Streptomyces sp. R302]
MNVLASILRTVVPVLAGWVLTVTGAVGVKVDSAALAGGITAAVTLVYYTVLRALEAGAERIGWEPLRLIAGLLLGWARPPAYEKHQPALDLAEVLRRDGRP